MKRLLFLFLLPALALPVCAQSLTSKVKTSAPIKDFRLPSFDKNGKRSIFMRAGEALIVSPTRIDVKDMQLTSFTKDGTGAFDTVILAPSATFIPVKDKEFVSGNESVRLIRENLEVTGEQWSYNHPEKRVLIGNNARVTFQDELKDIIK
ncbi:hypothetical protein [Rariglobus hedericola]|uniref:LPS export ABC transporter periplasmic protein LptC n=1 Tax=Rariglobus hedericola TaxID=2597822 RepID=A0A556QR71_9BACT|nr:hypothetical protein [Rariglobus hedericola]TSJ79137.1 hypothetical protein FPL22_07540 [Rariglobus hedericola]